MVEGDAGRPFGADGVLLGLVAHQGDAAHALGVDLLADRPGMDVAVMRLAAGHGDGIVVEDLVGDVGVGRDRLADGEVTRMEVGAVAQVLEDVRHLGEMVRADPRHALGTHVGEGLGVALHADGQRMAADAGHRHRAVRDLGRGVVRAAGAEIGHAGHAGLVAHLPAGAPLQRIEALAGPLAQALEAKAALVGLADHDRPAVGRCVEQRVLELLLDDRPFLLDHQHVALALAEGYGALRLERPHQAHLVDREPEALGFGLVEAELVERLAHVEIGFADGDDAEARIGPAEHQPVELVGAPVGQRRWMLQGDDALLLAQPLVGPADVHAFRRHEEVGRRMDLDPVRVDIDGGRGVDSLAQHLEGDPQARVARQREGMQAEIEIFPARSDGRAWTTWPCGRRRPAPPRHHAWRCRHSWRV